MMAQAVIIIIDKVTIAPQFFGLDSFLFVLDYFRVHSPWYRGGHAFGL